jgi:CheY-like chemotaxis protein
MSGWEAARRLKSDEHTKSIPLIALTAHAMEGDRQRAIDAGCDDYDVKPIDLSRLLAKIRNQLDAAAQRNSRPDADSGHDGETLPYH